MGAQLGLWVSFALIGFGLILVVEGLIYAVMPETMKRLLVRMVEVPVPTMRTGGIVAAIAGLGLLWLLGTI
jgi:uncharacterized protein YjeT (DUF2065 family)